MLDDGYYEQKNSIRRDVKNSLQAVEDLIQTEETKADEHAPVVLPPQLRLIREVTDDPAYSNAALAQI